MTEIGGKVPPKTIEELYKNHEFYIGLALAVNNDDHLFRFEFPIYLTTGIV